MSVSYILFQKLISAPPPAVIDTSDMDPELARYLNRNYWQQKSVEIRPSSNVATTQPSAPVIVADTKTSLVGGGVGQQFVQREEEVRCSLTIYIYIYMTLKVRDDQVHVLLLICPLYFCTSVDPFIDYVYWQVTCRSHSNGLFRGSTKPTPI